MRLTKSNYYSAKADAAYWSASFVKEMGVCPARAIAKVKREWIEPESIALLVGNYVDSYFEGTLEAFKAEHPQIFNSRNGELKKEYQHANVMIERAMSDELFKSYITGKKQRIFTGFIDGIPFKSKFDFYVPNKRIVDLKTTKDMQPMYKRGEGLLTFADYWQWPLQLAIYQHLEGHKLPVYLAVITKETPPDIAVISVPQEILDAELEALRAKLPLYEAMRQGIVEPERCEQCAYCRATRVLKEPVELNTFLEV